MLGWSPASSQRHERAVSVPPICLKWPSQRHFSPSSQLLQLAFESSLGANSSSSPTELTRFCWVIASDSVVDLLASANTELLLQLLQKTCLRPWLSRSFDLPSRGAPSCKDYSKAPSSKLLCTSSYNNSLRSVNWLSHQPKSIPAFSMMCCGAPCYRRNPSCSDIADIPL